MSNIPISSLPLALGLTADDNFVVVQGGTTKRVLLSTIAAQIAPSGGATVVVTSGATIGSPFNVPAGISRVLFNKTIGASSYALMALSSTYTSSASILIKDIKGDAVTDPITINFTGGELADGQSQIVLSTAYAGILLTPYPLGGGFYITAA